MMLWICQQIKHVYGDDEREKDVDGDLVPPNKVVALTPLVEVNKTCKPPDLPQRYL